MAYLWDGLILAARCRAIGSRRNPAPAASEYILPWWARPRRGLEAQNAPSGAAPEQRRRQPRRCASGTAGWPVPV